MGRHWARMLAGSDSQPGRAAQPSLLTELLSFWRLEEGVGLRADERGRHPLTPHGAVTAADPKLGAHSNSFEAGTSDYLSHAHTPALALNYTSFTIAGWYASANGIDCGILEKQAGASATYRLQQDAGMLLGQVSLDGLTWQAATDPTDISDTAWHFLVFYWDSVRQKVGVSVDNDTPTEVDSEDGPGPSDGAFNLGRHGSTPSYFSGRLDSIGIWTRVLSAGEIAQLYNAGAGLDYPFS